MPDRPLDAAPPHESLEERLRLLEEHIHELKHRQEGRNRPAAIMDRLMPSEVRVHLRAAQREQLLAVRAWLDLAIARVEGVADRPRRPESVHIE